MSHTMDPVSPPESPITASPVGGRKAMSHIHGQHAQIRSTFTAAQRYSNSSESRDTRYSIAPGLVGPNGLPFRSTNIRPDELSPRSSGSSVMNDIVDNEVAIDIDVDDEVEDNDNYADDDIDNDVESAADSDSDASGSIARSPASVKMTGTSNTSHHTPNTRRGDRTGGSISPAHTPSRGKSKSSDNISPSAANMAVDTEQYSATFLVVEETLVIEEVSDFDSDNGLIQALQPYSIEEAESEREQSPNPKRNRSGKLNPAQARRRSSARYARPPDLDRSVMSGLREFSFRAESDEEAIAEDDDGSDYDQAAQDIMRQLLRDEKRRRRLTSGSISKRTITESIGSGSDHEDLCSTIDPNEAGSSARRLRRRLERHSLLFTDPPAPRIDELDEPDTSDNEDDVKELIWDGESLARELPYYTLEYISMEVDSP
ncbi:hypothetical protein F503_07645 [Ophiostoma piceae UAMH 11346]|uniref:Uncharacterized protein n=1 Tax=Ophiostoma piceae (strain UAMH 11346) TaxID=1262450 RepID=S3BSD1_OPHP1|nr:hypothetical protein F503_07645 [Ophiostoma piceae UAMH 11346]